MNCFLYLPNIAKKYSMKKILFLFITLFIGNQLLAQSTEDYTVELSAVTQTIPTPKITLNWKRIISETPKYHIYKKSKTATTWGTQIAVLNATDSSFVDSLVIIDSAYEYQVFAMDTPSVTNWSASGYIYAGIKNPAIHNRGAIIVLVDSTFIDSCTANITKLMNDLSGDGWQVYRHNLSRNLADTSIKNLIVHDHTIDASINSLLILGHLAVPYSGDLNPDGHPNHLGAWPADLYYGCLTGWTDTYILDTGAGYIANRNMPGDGKWDQTIIPSFTVLQIGRIDVSNMPSFGRTEVQMMNTYLQKDHTYKMDSLNVHHRALISDNFGAFGGEAFAANGWRNFAPLVSKDSVQSIPFIASLADSSFQWAYGCGGGSFNSAGGIGATTDFAANAENGIFTMLFGSYFGDWNVQDNFLRAPLCANPPALTNCWAGRPNWYFHHMALGESIGYSTKLTQNNNAMLYSRFDTASGYAFASGYGAAFVHVALMGDPSLRTDYIKQASNLTITHGLHNGASLTWAASPDIAVIGYYVYRADSIYGYYKRLSNMLSVTNFHDTVGTNGLKYYMVRPVKLQSTPSGNYYNLGIGITDTATISFPHVYVTNITNVQNELSINVFPNPAKNLLQLSISSSNECTAIICIVNSIGETYYPTSKQLKSGINQYSLNISSIASGMYQVVVSTGTKKIVSKWIKE